MSVAFTAQTAEERLAVAQFLHPELKVRLAKVKAAMNAYQNAAQPGRAGSPALEGV